jgi:hypothetical protein
MAGRLVVLHSSGWERYNSKARGMRWEIVFIRGNEGGRDGEGQ